jgi:hypothetical protein
MELEAYRGSEPYIFASYAHRDAETVLPLLEQLSELGLHIWYDEGIRTGSEWPAELANALDGAAGVFMFPSNAYAASANCRNEANYALNAQKPILRVDLEQVDLPLRIRLRIKDLPRVIMYKAGGRETLQKLAQQLVYQAERHLSPSFEIKTEAVPPKEIRPSRRIQVDSSEGTKTIRYKPYWMTAVVLVLGSLVYFSFLVGAWDSLSHRFLGSAVGLFFVLATLGYSTFRTRLWFENDELHIQFRTLGILIQETRIPLRTLRHLTVEEHPWFTGRHLKVVEYRLMAETTTHLGVVVCLDMKPADDAWYLKSQLENRIAQMDFGDRLIPAMAIPDNVSIEEEANSLVIDYSPPNMSNLMKAILRPSSKTRLELDHSMLRVQTETGHQKTEIPISQMQRFKIAGNSLVAVKDDLSEVPLIKRMHNVYTAGVVYSKLQTFLDAIPPEQQPFAQTQLAATERLPAPFMPARGDRPFVAVSHAQADAAQVYPILKALHQAGLEVWFDNGTTTDAKARAEKAAQALQDCGLAIYMISARSADALHCRNEINFARNHGKQVVTIHLEEAKLPGGLVLRTGDLPSLSKKSFDQEQDFMAAVVAIVKDNLDSSPPGVPASQPTTADIALGGSLEGVPIYKGNGAYLFASFATADREAVAPIAQVFHQAGLPIWYDNGQADSRSRSSALDQAPYVLLFLSSTSLRSEQIQTELHAALDQRKSFIVIGLEEAQPPPGLALRLGDFQAILKYRQSEHEFTRELDQVISILRPKLYDQAAPQRLDRFSDRGRRAQGKLADMGPPPRGVHVKQEGNKLLFFERRASRYINSVLSGMGIFVGIMALFTSLYKSPLSELPPGIIVLAFTASILFILVSILVKVRNKKTIIADQDSIRKQTGTKEPKVLAQTHQIYEFKTFTNTTEVIDDEGRPETVTTYEVHIHLKNGHTVTLFRDMEQEEQANYIVERLVNFYLRQDV